MKEQLLNFQQEPVDPVHSAKSSYCNQSVPLELTRIALGNYYEDEAYGTVDAQIPYYEDISHETPDAPALKTCKEYNLRPESSNQSI